MKTRSAPLPALGAAISYTVQDACEVVGIGVTTLYALVKEGKLRLVKVGRRSLVPASDLRALIEGAEAEREAA